MIDYRVENAYATFRRVADRFDVAANAAPGSFVKVIAPNDRNQKRERAVRVTVGTRSFTINVPYELGRDLRTAPPKSQLLATNLAKCFERAFFSTISEESFNALGLESSCGSYSELRRSIQREGYDELALDLAKGLGDELYADLIAAIAKDLGFDHVDPKQKTECGLAGESQSMSLQLVGQPLALFPT